MRFYSIFWEENQKVRKTINLAMFASFWINSLIFVHGKSRYMTISFAILLLPKTDWRQFFYASALLWMIKCVMTLSKFTAKSLACGSCWFHSHFDNVTTQFIINKGQTHKKPDVNLLTWAFGISSQMKLKLRRNCRNKIVKIYAS